jgi:GWxTD domain-containing protein
MQRACCSLLAGSSFSFHSGVFVLKTLLSFFLVVAALHSAAPAWLDRVAPIITSSEKRTYLSIPAAERREYEEQFWSNKSITSEEYFRRLAYIDSTFGSGREASGANTDQGRIYLSIGAPTKVSRFPASRIFVPIEIWYYDVVPGVLNSELRLIFYLKNDIGFPRLYSPTLDTIRALLLPEAASTEMFGPNDSLTENTIRQSLNVPPAEDEVVSAAVSVATGVTSSENDKILGMIASPQAMLKQPLRTDVQSKLILPHSKLDVLESGSEYGGSQIDLRLEATVMHELDVEVLDSDLPIYQSQLHLNFPKPERVEYAHRLDLLPGSYRVIFTLDGKPNAYPLKVAERAELGEIYRVDQVTTGDRRQTPFQFQGKQWDLSSDGKYAVVPLAHPTKVTWRIRKGWEVLWTGVSEPAPVASIALPTKEFAPGTYSLEASIESGERSAELVIRRESDTAQAALASTPKSTTVLSYNANLAPARRLAFVGHQFLLRGKYDEARRSLQSSFAQGATDEAQIELARADALSGNLDEARNRLRRVLNKAPEDFAALSVFAYIETRFQDYEVAAEFYRRALAVRDSPALRLALAKLPQQ